MPATSLIWACLVTAGAGLATASAPALAQPTAQPKPAASAAQPHQAPCPQGPLHFDPPAAGPARPPSGYEACIDHPSPDGLTSECQALLTPTRAPARRKR